jgi:16S rRNA (cytosine1402-N4)-methyltransferase
MGTSIFAKPIADGFGGRIPRGWPLPPKKWARGGVLNHGDYHIPVMQAEVLDYLAVSSGGTYVDGTLGGGGHARAILEATSPDGVLLGLDRDPNAIRESRRVLSEFGDRVQIVNANYADASQVVDKLLGRKVDGFLVDAGVSSHQIDTATRGFSFAKSGPLDMRMSPDLPSLEEYLAEVSVDELSKALWRYGEVKAARRLAPAIIEAFSAGDLTTTVDLANLVERVSPSNPRKRRTIHPATLVFQALRIAVNDELACLDRAVTSIPSIVRPGGRVVMISFHSLEDRLVKQQFREMARDREYVPKAPVDIPIKPSLRILTRKPVMASEEEVKLNPRARSAKLRAAEVV